MKQMIAAVLGVLAITVIGNIAMGVVVVDMDFDGATGLENGGVGPAGVLEGTASIGATAGVGGTGGLVMDGSEDSGLRLDIGELGAFSGAGDFALSFDFKANVAGLESGMLFNTDPFTFIEENELEAPNDSEAALNVGLFGEEVGFDLWFFGGGGIAGPFNDGNFHTVNIAYDSIEKVFSLTSPSSEDIAEIFLDEEEFPFAVGGRDTSNDLTWLGNNTNGDLGEEETGAPCNCTFDNLVIDGPSPPPVKLIVDRTTGDLELEVIAGDPTTIDAIRIESDAGTLVAANYNGLGASGGSFADWSVNAADEFAISESGSAATIDNADGPFDLGNAVWTAFFDEDLQVIINDTVLDDEVRGITEFVGGNPLIFGDLDLDDDVDEDDFALFVSGFGSDVAGLRFFDAYFNADLNGDGFHNFEDWNAFAGAFDEFQGEGAFAALLGVPEPATAGLLIVGLGATLAASRRTRRSFALALVVAATFAVADVERAEAVVEAEYLFDSGFSDSSGNGRTGVPLPDSLFGPTVSGGKLNLTGGFEEAMQSPLPNDLLAGLTTYTIQMDINSTGNSGFPESGVVLASSANSAEPNGDPEGSNQSMSLFVEPQEEIFDDDGLPTGEFEGGSLVFDYFFVGEVRVQDALLLDGQDHSIIVTYQAPADPGDPEDPNPGTGFLNVDGEWLGIGELTPRPADVHDLVQFGTTANPDFPFECFEGECFTAEFEGTMDNLRVLSGADAQIPTLLRAEVDRATGDVSLIGGQFAREIQYYEINSESGTLSPNAWDSLSDKNLDPVDDGADLGETWVELNDQTTQLAEGFLKGTSVFSDAENADVSLGNVYNVAVGGEDLEIIAVLADGENIAVAVSYEGVAPLIGDFNNDDVVDDLDVAQWEGDFGINGDSDANGDGLSGGPDFIAWQKNLGNSAPAVGAVPEPSGLAVLLAGAFAAAGARGRFGFSCYETYRD